MYPSLPLLPLMTLSLALGALGGVAAQPEAPPEPGARFVAAAAHPTTRHHAKSRLRSRVQQVAALDDDASAQAALVDDGEAASPAEGGPAQVQRSRDGLFYVWAKVNGHPIRFLVDTGATHVTLRAADAAAVGASPASYGGRMETVGGSARMAWTRLDEVAIGNNRVTGLRAAVVKGGLGVSLLGANMLSKLGTVTISGDRLQLG